MNLNYKSSDFPNVANDINDAVSDLSLEEISELRNQLIQHEVAFECDYGEIKIYSFSEIEAWGQDVGITFTESDDLPEHPINYWIDGEPSDTSFRDEREALIIAFERIVVE